MKKLNINEVKFLYNIVQKTILELKLGTADINDFDSLIELKQKLLENYKEMELFNKQEENMLN